MGYSCHRGGTGSRTEKTRRVRVPLMETAARVAPAAWPCREEWTVGHERFVEVPRGTAPVLSGPRLDRGRRGGCGRCVSRGTPTAVCRRLSTFHVEQGEPQFETHECALLFHRTAMEPGARADGVGGSH